MARSELAATEIDRSGVSDSGTSGTTDGHMFRNLGQEFVEVENTDTAAHTVTFPTPAVQHGLAVADLSISVGAGDVVRIGPFPLGTFNQSGADGGMVYIDYEGGAESTFVTSVYKLRAAK